MAKGESNVILDAFMKKLTIKEIEELAKLARLGLSEKEKETLSREMAEILNYVATLNEVNTEETEATNQVSGIKNVCRSDIKRNNNLSISEKLKNTPKKSGNFIEVKKVLE